MADVHDPHERRNTILRNFTDHGDQAAPYAQLCAAAREFALLIHAQTPVSREQSVALTHLETCLMWVKASIARHEAGSTPNEHTP